jgi:hypothetical protein
MRARGLPRFAEHPVTALTTLEPDIEAAHQAACEKRCRDVDAYKDPPLSVRNDWVVLRHEERSRQQATSFHNRWWASTILICVTAGRSMMRRRDGRIGKDNHSRTSSRRLSSLWRCWVSICFGKASRTTRSGSGEEGGRGTTELERRAEEERLERERVQLSKRQTGIRS